MSEEKVIGEINIKITDGNIEYETELDFLEVFYWLDILKALMIKKTVDK